MKRLRSIILLGTLSASSVLLANDSEKSLEQKINSLKLEKMQAEFMIETLVKTGRMNHKEAEGAKREVASVKEEDKEQIRKEAFDDKSFFKSFATK